jgi:alkanesulfonate monooxygenase SsuD/methylene tetrahydromethanopterin reductase-like flavin-dependent oxidoreductase (luciferase family)
LNPASLRMAGAIADGICLNQMRVEHVPTMLDEVRAGAAEAGRDLPDDYPVVARFFCHVTDDPDPVKAMLPHVFGAYVATPGYNRFYRWQGYEEAADRIASAAKDGDKAAMSAAYTSDIVDDLFLIGTADEIVDRLAGFGGAGVTTAAIAPLSPDAQGAAATFKAIAEARDRVA